jgi:DNA ligase-1
MLAAKPKGEADYAKITYPKLASPKYDGIRAVVRGGKLWSRKGKLIPNAYCQKLFGRKAYEGFDGELIVGDPTAKNCFQTTMSGCMSEEGEPDVKYYVFDYLRGNVAGYAYSYRVNELRKAIIGGGNSADAYLEWVAPSEVATPWAAAELESKLLALGFEGMMLRDPAGQHKHGRSTMREQGLIAIKRFVQAEGRIVGVEEQMHNANEATVSELGRTKRSSAKAGKVAAGKLGAVQVEVIACSEAPELVGSHLNVGTGFNDDQRAVLWKQRAGLGGQVITFKFQAHGSKDAPRIPVFIGFRPEGA